MAWPPSNLRFWLCPAYTAHMYKDSPNTTPPSAHATTDGDTVGAMFEPYTGLELISSGTSNSPTLQSDATRLNSLLFTGGNKNIQCQNSKGAFRFIHVDQSATIIFWFKAVTALASATEIIVDTNSASSGSSSNGFSVYRTANENIGFILTKGTTGTPAVTITGPVINDTNWHYVVVRIAQGSNACTVAVDGGTATTGTISGASSAGADFLYEMQFGLSGASTAPGSFYLDNFAILEGAIAAGDLTSWLALNPARTSTSQATPSVAGASLDPDDVPFLHHWHRMTEIATLFQEDGTTAVASADDPVGLVVNKKTAFTSSDWKRNLNQTDATKCPLWKTNQVNSLGAPLWAGQAHAGGAADFSGENTLVIPTWPDGSFTWIGVYRCTERPSGSHLMARTASEYIVQTSSLYQSGTRGDCVAHAGGQSATTDFAPDPEGLIIVAYRQDGDINQISMFNVWTDVVTGGGRFSPTHMGRTFRDVELSTTWDFFGSMYESIVYAAWLDNGTITKLIRPLVERYAIEGVAGLTGNGYRSMGMRAGFIGL